MNELCWHTQSPFSLQSNQITSQWVVEYEIRQWKATGLDVLNIFGLFVSSLVLIPSGFKVLLRLLRLGVDKLYLHKVHY